MKYIVTFLLSCVVAASCIFALEREPEFTRQECIQKVELVWLGYDAIEVESVIEQISQSLLSLKSDDIEVPSYIFPFRHRDEWYLQFKHDCLKKKERTKMLIKLITPAVKNMPKYTVTDEVVVPSPKTISLKGEFWKDDQFE